MVSLEHEPGYETHTLAENRTLRRKVNFLTYKAVISLQSSIPAQLERCWTQEPATLEDALGRVTAVHLEFLDSWEVSWKTPSVLYIKKSNTYFLGFRSRPRSSLSTITRPSKDKARRVCTPGQFMGKGRRAFPCFEPMLPTWSAY